MASQMSSRLMPDSIQLLLPPAWTEFPLEPAAASRHTEEMLESLSSAQELDRAELRQVEVSIAQVQAMLRRERVVLASTLVGVEETDDGDGWMAILAALTVATITRRQFGTDVPLLADVLLTAFSDRERAEGSSFTDIEPAKRTEVGGFDAVKLVRLLEIGDPLDGVVRQFTQTYLVPVAEGDGVVVVQFSTVNLQHARDFSELFDKVASTLRILYPADPTFVDDERE